MVLMVISRPNVHSSSKIYLGPSWPGYNRVYKKNPAFEVYIKYLPKALEEWKKLRQYYKEKYKTLSKIYSEEEEENLPTSSVQTEEKYTEVKRKKNRLLRTQKSIEFRQDPPAKKIKRSSQNNKKDFRPM